MSDNRRRYQNKGKQQSPEEKANTKRLIEEVKKQLPEGVKFTDDNIRSELFSNKMNLQVTVENMSKPDFKPWTSTRPNRQNNDRRGHNKVTIFFGPSAHAEEPAPKKTHNKAKPAVEETKAKEETVAVEEQKPVVKEEAEKPKEEPVKEEPKPEPQPEPVQEEQKQEPAEEQADIFEDVPYQQNTQPQPVVQQIAYPAIPYPMQQFVPLVPGQIFVTPQNRFFQVVFQEVSQPTQPGAYVTAMPPQFLRCETKQ